MGALALVLRDRWTDGKRQRQKPSLLIDLSR